jgi:hypothetical protein
MKYWFPTMRKFYDYYQQNHPGGKIKENKQFFEFLNEMWREMDATGNWSLTTIHQ